MKIILARAAGDEMMYNSIHVALQPIKHAL
jgi:hypothetical protein